MFTYPRIRSAALYAVAIAFLAVSASSLATHSWGGYHWARKTDPFTLKLGDNLTSADWKAHLSTTSREWNSGNAPLQTSIVAGQARKRCSMVAGTTQVCNGRYGTNGWLGLASINITGGTHITQGSAKVNDTYFDTPTYNTPDERLHVMCQEVAHTFGLGHTSEDGTSQKTCMDYSSSPDSTGPNQHDFDQLETIYAHTDTTTTVAARAALAASTSDVTDDPISWGHRIRQSANGRHSHYERLNGDGSKTLTHVYWTLEAAANCPSCDHRYDR